MNWTYKQPVRIRFGNGIISCLPEEIKALGGKNGVLITSASFVRRGMAEAICTASGGTLKHVYGKVSANPDVAECNECAQLMRDNSCDFVVALGGGSVMDCAKAAASICLTDEPIENYLATGKPMPLAHLPLIAVPTTAGTGSEITCVSVLSDHKRGIKSPINSDGFYPTLAIVDPELTYSVPAYLTACTGFDVLCHAIEAYWSRYHQPICDTLAVHAAHLVLTNLQKAYDEPNNVEARENMAEASVIAGLAFTLPKTTSAHACSYPLTNLLGIPHGEACALTIDYFLRFNDEHGCSRIHSLATALGFPDVASLADAIGQLKRSTGLRCDLKDMHLGKDQFEAVVQGSKHPNLLNNPVEVTENDLRVMYNSLCYDEI